LGYGGGEDHRGDGEIKRRLARSLQGGEVTRNPRIRLGASERVVGEDGKEEAKKRSRVEVWECNVMEKRLIGWGGKTWVGEKATLAKREVQNIN